MIVFDLRCGQGHVFETWFRSSDAYEAQRADGLIACPLCGNEDVEKALMAPNIAAKGNRRAQAPAPPASPAALMPAEKAKRVLEALAHIQAEALKNSKWVGTAFPERVRAMHHGEVDAAPIHGQASAEEAKALVEEGVPVAPLLFPVVPPSARN